MASFKEMDLVRQATLANRKAEIEQEALTKRQAEIDAAAAEPDPIEVTANEVVSELFDIHSPEDFKEFNEGDLSDPLASPECELTADEIVDLKKRLDAPGPNKEFFVPENPGVRVGVSLTPDFQPNFAVPSRVGQTIPFEIARPDWDKVVPHTESMGTINPKKPGVGGGFQISKYIVPDPSAVIDDYDVPYTYGYALDGKAALAVAEAKVRSNPCEE